MRLRSTKIQVAIFLLALITVLSCATRKSKKDVSFLGKVYHNTTAKYNGYFNADEIMQLTYLKLDASNKDNYNKTLRILPFMGGDADAVKSELDRAIEKVSIVAASHPVSHWRDDCYLLVGEAQFLQQDYESAEETMEYFAQEFDPLKAKRSRSKRERAQAEDKEERVDVERTRKEKIRRRKKSKRKNNRRMTREEREREKAKEEAEKAKRLAEQKEEREKEKAEEEEGESYFMKHRPVYEDGLVWLARIYIKNDKFSLAQSYLRRVEETRGLHKDVRAPLHTTKALYYMDVEQPGKAAVELEKAFVWEDDKGRKARYAFILGQVMEDRAQYAAAAEYFDRVIDLKPKYELVFNAQLRKATNAYASGAMSKSDFIDEIDDMLNDDKNIEYQDQLYTALASVYFASGDSEKGIATLKKALGKGEKTSVYKTEAYYKIAEFFFAREDYVSAKAYYDSTLTAMPDDDLRKPEVKLLSANLTDIATQITIVQLQDSLLALAALPEEELLARAEAMQEKEDEAREEEEGPGLEGFKTASSILPATSGGASFFAYDRTLRDKGLQDFKQEWGDRPLEDNWRRSQKSVTSFVDNEDEDRSKVEEDISSEDEQLIKKYFGGVPTTAEEKKQVLKKKEDALFALGKLYRDNMDNCEKSFETLEQLMRDFPSTEHEKDALFYLYLCAVQLDDVESKTRYGNKLVQKYPESLYAQSIIDPDFVKKQQEAKNKLENYYQKTYEYLQSGQYVIVEKRLNEVDQLFSDRGPLTAKFALLSAMMAGQRGGKESYIKALQDVIAKHKETPEATRAREIMRFLQGDKDAFAVMQDGQMVNTKFKLEDDKLHYVFAVIFDLDDKDMSDVKISVSEYNRRFHRRDKLSISTLDLDIENSTPLILVRKFPNKEEALKYYGGIQRKPDKFIPDGIQYEVYAISQHNYREVIKERSVKTYRSFFNENYLVE